MTPLEMCLNLMYRKGWPPFLVLPDSEGVLGSIWSELREASSCMELECLQSIKDYSIIALWVFHVGQVLWVESASVNDPPAFPVFNDSLYRLSKYNCWMGSMNITFQGPNSIHCIRNSDIELTIRVLMSSLGEFDLPAYVRTMNLYCSPNIFHFSDHSLSFFSS